MEIVVFGSLNMDLVVRAPHLPQRGETLTGRAFFTAPGGKGANQAVAAARLGAQTVMVGRTGGDVFGPALLESLKTYGVDPRGVVLDPTQSSGVALIEVEDSAENHIVIVPGANGDVGPADVERLKLFLPGAKALLLQLEVPLAAVIEAARAAKECGVTVILDPAPARELPDELLRLVDWLTPNEVEAAMLVGFRVDSAEKAADAGRTLVNRGVKQVIVKMGARGALWFDGVYSTFLPALKVEAIDTVAAGDAFNGAFAAGLAAGLPVEEALRWGITGGALSTTRAGAQPSMPSLEELKAKLG